MICCCIIYPRTATSRFDVDYYLDRHMPMTLRLLSPALKGATVETGVASTVESVPPAHAAVCRLLFDSIDAFMSAFAPHAATLQSDIANYTDVVPLIQFNEVKLSQ
jgi:uncharacterized protein (TIGR02118 family)